MPNNDYANEPNQSRSEDIIQSILDNTEYDEPARSRIEYLLVELKNAIEGGGGGGGVTSYSPLTEKPKIDNHTLQAGNNTSSDLGLQTKLTFDSAPTENSTNPVTSGGVYTALGTKANSADVYNKSAVDTALGAKADKSTTYTKTEVDTALSSKQNTISDLSTIRSGAALGATAVQPVSGKGLSTNDYTTAEKEKLAGIEAQANKTTVDSALSGTSTNPVQNKVVKSALDGKQATLTTAQLAAVNSGITAEKLTQDENNISLLRAYGGLKNYATINNGTYTANSGGGTHSITIPLLSPITGDIVISIGNITSNDVDSSTCAFVFKNDITSRDTVAVSRGNNINVPVSMGTFVATKVEIYPAATYQTSSGDTVSWSDLMICAKEDWDNSHDYQPYSLSNTELTAKEQVNENNIISLTNNGGGKNKLKITAASSAEMTINDDKSVSITVNATTQKQYNLTGWIPNNYVGMKISGMTVNSNVSTGYFISVQYSNNGSSWANETDIATIGSATILDYPYVNVGIVVRGGNNLNGVLFKPMISAEGEPYQPYALSNVAITPALQECVDNGVKNLYKFEDLGATAGSGTGVTLTDNGDGTFSATGTASGANYARYLLKQAPIKAGNYYISGISGGALETYRLRVGTGSGDAYLINLGNNYAQFTIATDTTVTVQFVVNSGVTVTNLSIKPMIITKAMYDAGFTDYQPYALPNTVITPALQSLLDESKNLADFKNAPKAVSQNSTNIKTDTAVTVSSTGAWGHSAWNVAILEKGDYILVCDVTNYSAESATCRVGIGSSNTNTVSVTGNGKVIFPFTWASDAKVNVYVYANYSANTYANSLTVSNVMICKADEYNASSNYAKYRNPFAPSKQVGEVDLNDLVAEGEYFAGQLTTAHHAPETGYYFVKVMALPLNASDLIQIGFRLNMPEKIYVRHRTYKSTDPYYEWSSWFLFTGTVVS